MENRSYAYSLLLAAMMIVSTFVETKPMENFKNFVREATKGRIFSEPYLNEYKLKAKMWWLKRIDATKKELDMHGSDLVAFYKRNPTLQGYSARQTFNLEDSMFSNNEQDKAIFETAFVRFVTHSARLRALQQQADVYAKSIDNAYTSAQIKMVKIENNEFIIKNFTSLVANEEFPESVIANLRELVKQNKEKIAFYSMPEQTVWQKWFQPKSKSGAIQASPMVPGCKGFSLKTMVVQRARRAAIRGEEAFERSQLTPEQEALGGLHEYPTIPTPDNAIIAVH